MARFNKLEFLRLLRHADLTHSEYRVLVTLLTYTNSDGENAHPGYSKLADQCPMSRGTVSKCITRLKGAGWLKETSPGRPSPGGGGNATVFAIRIPAHIDQGGFPEGTEGEPPDGTTSSPYTPPDFSDPWESQ